MMPGAICAVRVVVWAVSASTWDAAASMWAVTSFMLEVAAYVHEVQVTCGLLSQAPHGLLQPLCMLHMHYGAVSSSA